MIDFIAENPIIFAVIFVLLSGAGLWVVTLKKKLSSAKDDIVLTRTTFSQMYPLIVSLNLTQNTFRVISSGRWFFKQPAGSDNFQKLIENTLDSIPNLVEKDQFARLFSREALISAFDFGDNYTEYIYRLRNPEGEEHWVCTRVVFYPEQISGKDVMALGVSSIFDAQKAQEQALSDAIDAASAANDAKTNFLAHVGKDVRNPLNTVQGFVRIAKNNLSDTKKIEESLDGIDAASRHLMELVDDILDISRLSSGTVKSVPKLVSLSEACRSLELLLRPDIEKKNIHFVTDINIEHDAVYADILHMSRIIVNVLDNAIKFSNDDGEVSVKLTETVLEKDGWSDFRIIVTDHGVGMSKDQLRNIFDMFSRGTGDFLSGNDGSGLGMAISKELIDLLGGTIDIESEEGVGTTVTLSLEIEYSSDVSPLLKNKTNPEDISLEGKRILVVEDNQLNRDIICEILEDEGMVAESASDGTFAVEILAEKGPDYYDAVLMDIEMPYMNGLDATRTIRAMDNAGFFTLPIIAMTANVSQDDVDDALQSGMNSHVGKPINVAELLKTLKLQIARR